MTAIAPTSLPIIEMINASAASTRSPRLPALEGIDWRVNAGDYWVVGGLPGSGKSDLLATAAGLQRPLAGTHLLFGTDLTQLNESELLSERLRIGLVFENGGRLLSTLTLAENVALPLQYHRDYSDDEIQRRVETILALTELTEYADLLPNRTTRTWRQRAALARALALQPEILLVDNPLGGLDPRHISWWIDFLARLAGGHELMNGKPITLVVAPEDVRPWLDQGRQFALIKKRRWVPLSSGAELTADTEPLLREWQELIGDGGKT